MRRLVNNYDSGVLPSPAPATSPAQQRVYRSPKTSLSQPLAQSGLDGVSSLNPGTCCTTSPFPTEAFSFGDC